MPTTLSVSSSMQDSVRFNRRNRKLERVEERAANSHALGARIALELEHRDETFADEAGLGWLLALDHIGPLDRARLTARGTDVRFFGWLVLAFGVILTIAGFVVDPVVPAGDAAVNNIGLLNTKANLIMAGGAAAIVGGILALIGEIQKIAQRLTAPLPADGAYSVPVASALVEDAATIAEVSPSPSDLPTSAALDRITLMMIAGLGGLFVLVMIYAAMSG